jgi:hypothetical protein
MSEYVYPGDAIESEVAGKATDLVSTARIFAQNAKDSIGSVPALDGVTFGLIAAPTNVGAGSVTSAPDADGGVATADGGGISAIISGANP